MESIRPLVYLWQHFKWSWICIWFLHEILKQWVMWYINGMKLQVSYELWLVHFFLTSTSSGLNHFQKQLLWFCHSGHVYSWHWGGGLGHIWPHSFTSVSFSTLKDGLTSSAKQHEATRTRHHLFSKQQIFKQTLSTYFTIYTKFSEEDNILLTLNMSNFTNTLNSNQYRLLPCRPLRRSPD